MKEVNGQIKDGTVALQLAGRIDSNNAKEAEDAVFAIAEQVPGGKVVIDCSDLEYISSAGLRMLLRLRKAHPDLDIENVNSEVYEILDMTGFTQMLNVRKAYREVSIEGCEIIGQGANGLVYRIDEDNVVKVYKNADALSEIQHEREVARKALVLGIPTAISYDVVRVGEHYGSVFELLNAKSFAKIIANEPEKMDWCVEEYIGMLGKIHGTLVPPGELPTIKQKAMKWADGIKEEVPADAHDKYLRLLREIPDDNHMLHGDYHTKNIVLVGDEVLIIDMDTLAVGHPIFELAQMYNSYLGFSEYDNDNIVRFQGFDRQTAIRFWRKSLARYLGTDDEEAIRAVEDKAKVLGLPRIIRWNKRHPNAAGEHWMEENELLTKIFLETLERVDTLLFLRNEITVEALKENLPAVTEFVDRHLEELGCGMKEQTQIDLALEEMYINIANYAYAPGRGEATVRVKTDKEARKIAITLIDQGMPYDPLAKEDPDVSLSAEERNIGGLGIFLVKQTMDDLSYEYTDGKNIFTMTKTLS